MDELVAVAFHNWGVWVASCPRPGCQEAERLGHGLTGTVFTCSGCGLRCRAQWPPNLADIEAVLSLRPAEETRNWLPGETIADLHVENLEHGIFDPRMLDPEVVLAVPDGKVFQITGNEIELGAAALAADVARLAIGRG